MISSLSKSLFPHTLSRPAGNNVSAPDIAPDRTTFSDKVVGIAGIAGLSAIPVWGATVATLQGFELAIAGDDAAYLLDKAAMANLGSTAALVVGLVSGGPALAVGAVGLGLCGLVGAYGAHRALEDYRA